jgi:hypothetical protein
LPPCLSIIQTSTKIIGLYFLMLNTRWARKVYFINTAIETV